MAIELYAGLPGAGKTYEAVGHLIVPALREGRRVVTNVPLRVDVMRADGMDVELLEIVTIDALQEAGALESVPAGAVVVLDECWRLWPSGQKQHLVAVEHRAFLAEHRHRVDAEGRSQHIALIAQDSVQLASWVRQLVDTTHCMRSHRRAGLKRRYQVRVVEGAVQTKDVSRYSYRTLERQLSEGIWRYYRSAMHSETGDVGDEAVLDATTYLRSKWWFVGAAVVVVAIVGAVVMLLSGAFWGTMVGADEGVAAEAAEAAEAVGALEGAAEDVEALLGAQLAGDWSDSVAADGSLSITILNGGRWFRESGDLVDYRLRQRLRFCRGGGRECGEVPAVALVGWQPVEECLGLWRGRVVLCAVQSAEDAPDEFEGHLLPPAEEA